MTAAGEGRLAVVESGTGAGGLPVVLLHGFGGSARQNADIQATLGDKVHSLAIDLPAHGASPGEEIPAPKDAANAVLAELAARGIERAVVVGHSMGGAIACLVSLFDPERVASLILLAPGGFGARIDDELMMPYAAASDAESLRAILPAFFGSSFSVSEDVIRQMAQERENPEVVKRLTAFAASAFKDGKQGVLPLDAILRPDLPTTIIWGDEDRILPVHQTDDLPAHVELIRVRTMGHMVMQEAPQQVVKAILAKMT